MRRRHDDRAGKPPAAAVALRYDGSSAPRVTASGHGETAQRIVEIAESHRVPTRRDEELAMLLAQVPLGEEIPEALYVAVAQVLVYAYEVSGGELPSRD